MATDSRQFESLPPYRLDTSLHKVIDAFELLFLGFGFPMVRVVWLHMQRPTMQHYHNTVRPCDEITHLSPTPMFVHLSRLQILSTFGLGDWQLFGCAVQHSDYLKNTQNRFLMSTHVFVGLFL